MKRTASLSLIILIFSASLFSQKNKDALYLKDGSQIFGKMEQREDDKIGVRTSDGSLFVFDTAKVDHFIINSNTPAERKTKGFGIGTELGFLAGPQNSNYPAPFSFGLNASYSFSKRLLAEAGTGIEFIGNSYSPIYGGIRLCLSDRRAAPFVFGRMGYMILLSENHEQVIYYPPWYNYYPSGYWYTDEREYKGGPTLTLGLGTSISMGDIETYASFAYRHFRTKEIVTTSTSSTEEFFYYYNRLEVKFGFRF